MSAYLDRMNWMFGGAGLPETTPRPVSGALTPMQRAWASGSPLSTSLGLHMQNPRPVSGALSPMQQMFARGPVMPNFQQVGGPQQVGGELRRVAPAPGYRPNFTMPGPQYGAPAVAQRSPMQRPMPAGARPVGTAVDIGPRALPAPVAAPAAQPAARPAPTTPAAAGAAGRGIAARLMSAAGSGPGMLAMTVLPALLDPAAQEYPTELAGNFTGLEEFGDFSAPQAPVMPAPMPAPQMDVGQPLSPADIAAASAALGFAPAAPTMATPRPAARPAVAPRAPMAAPAAPMPTLEQLGPVYQGVDPAGLNANIDNNTRMRALQALGLL